MYFYRNELQGIITAIEKLTGTEGDSGVKANDLFKRVDKNADGKLSLQEFIQGAKEDEELASMIDNI